MPSGPAEAPEGADLRVDDQVVAPGGLKGTVRFIGTVDFADGEWVGIELTEGAGKNNGTLRGVKYFTCPDGQGIFLRAGKLKKAAPPPQRPPANGKPKVSITTRAPTDVATPKRAAGKAAAQEGRKKETIAMPGPQAAAVRDRASASLSQPDTTGTDKRVSVLSSRSSRASSGDGIPVQRTAVQRPRSSNGAHVMPVPSAESRCTMAPADSYSFAMSSEPSVGPFVDSAISNAGTIVFRGRESRKLSEMKAPTELSQRAWSHLEQKREELAELGQDSGHRQPWRMGEWIASQIDGVLTQAFLEAMESEDVDMELAFVKALGEVGTVEFIANIIRQDAVIYEMASTLMSKARELSKASAATGEELNVKFAAEGSAFQMNYGTLADFSKGLESLIGSPDADLMKAMEKDHCGRADSDEFWTTGNYGITTTPRLEWMFVVRPDDGLFRLQKLNLSRYSKLQGWPKETIDTAHPRQGKNIADFNRHTWEINCRLGAGDEKRGIKGIGERTLMLEEFIGIRLYTGPMFEKYNAVNRGGALTTTNGQGAFMEERWQKLCIGNRYVTTIHVINSALIKLNKLSKVCTVYRGLTGGLLPEAFWTPNECGAKAAVEFGFTSTTTNREVAMGYASGKGAGTVLEIKTGAIDRGADISMLSQYPHEKEICFPPLTSLEVLGTRVEGAVLVVEVRINVNMSALTVEEVVAKRQKLVKDMAGNLKLEISALKGQYGDCGGLYKTISSSAGQCLDQAASEAAEFYNKDENLLERLNHAITVKESALHALEFAKAAHDTEGNSMKVIAHKAPLVIKALRVLGVEEEHFVKDHAKEMYSYFSKVHEQAEGLEKLSTDLSATNDRTRRQAFKDFTKTVLQQRDLARLAWDLSGNRICKVLQGEGFSATADDLVIEKAEPRVQPTVVDKSVTLLKDVVKNRFGGMQWLRGFDKVNSALVCSICKGNVKTVESLAVSQVTARDLRFKVEVPVTVYLLMERKGMNLQVPPGMKVAQASKDHQVEQQMLASGVPKDFDPTHEEPLKGVDETRGKLWDVYKRDFQPGWVSFECPFTALIFVSVTDANYEWRVLACQLLQAIGAPASEQPEVLAHLLKLGPFAGCAATDLTKTATMALDTVGAGFVERAVNKAVQQAHEGNKMALELLLKKKAQLTPSTVPGRCEICREEGGDCPGNWTSVIMRDMGLTREMVMPQPRDAKGELCKRFRNFWSREETIQKARHDAALEHMYQAVRTDNSAHLQLLLSCKASPNWRDEETTPVYLAAESNNCEVLRCLLEAKASVKGKAAAAKGGKSPIFAAVVANSFEALQLLIEKDADLDEPNDSGVTPVHMAARLNHVDALRKLLDQGADLNVEAMSGKTPLDFAQEAQNQEAAALLTANGAALGNSVKARDRSKTIELKTAYLEKKGQRDQLPSRRPTIHELQGKKK